MREFPPSSRLNAADLLRVGSAGIRHRRLRAALSALGISIGIAAIVGVLGISDSSKTGLLAELGRQGNLLTVAPGQNIASGGTAELPIQARGMVARLPGVQHAATVGALANATARRTDQISPYITSGIVVQATDPSLPSALDITVARGDFLNAATAQYPVVVLGSNAARALGIQTIGRWSQIYVTGHWFTVVGILAPVPLVPQIDNSALIGAPIAQSLLGYDGHPTAVYVRTDPNRVAAVDALLAAATNPASPVNVVVSRPSDAIAARLAAKNSFTGLFLGLGAVALLVGGIGIANIMVISVLERRSEIGLRRALGATRRHVAGQFLAESLLLALVGGAAGTLLGAMATASYAKSQHWTTTIPTATLWGGLGTAIFIGAIAGLYPAMRAARLPPTEALRTP